MENISIPQDFVSMYIAAEFKSEKMMPFQKKWSKLCKEPTSPYIYYFAGMVANKIYICYAVKDAQAWLDFRKDVFHPMVKEFGLIPGEDLSCDLHISGPKEKLDLIKKDIGDNNAYHYYEEHGPSNGFTRLNTQNSDMTKPFVAAKDWTWIIPFMTVNDLKLAEPLAAESVKLAKDNEPGCLFYGMTHNVEGNKFHCREVYTSPGNLKKHLGNVGEVLGKMMGDDKPMTLADKPMIFASSSHVAEAKEIVKDVGLDCEFCEFRDAFVREGLM